MARPLKWKRTIKLVFDDCPRDLLGRFAEGLIEYEYLQWGPQSTP